MYRIVYGIHPVCEALRIGRGERGVQALWVASAEMRGRKEWHFIETQADLQGVRVEGRTREQLDDVCGATSHQGVAAVVGAYTYLSLEDLYEGVGKTPLLIAVDGVTDPQNLGAMMRAGFVLGATGMILTKDRCASVTPVVVRVSSGASEYLPCARVTNLARALRQLKNEGLWTIGAIQSGGSSPAEAPFTEASVLVLGSEARGIRPNVLKACDFRVSVPAVGAITALNVASATAVLCYEALRQRHCSYRDNDGEKGIR